MRSIDVLMCVETSQYTYLITSQNRIITTTRATRSYNIKTMRIRPDWDPATLLIRVATSCCLLLILNVVLHILVDATVLSSHHSRPRVDGQLTAPCSGRGWSFVPRQLRFHRQSFDASPNSFKDFLPQPLLRDRTEYIKIRFVFLQYPFNPVQRAHGSYAKVQR